jgi:carbon storage regulator CsrA
MLVLTRKSEEAVVVGGLQGTEPILKVTVLEISSRKVRLGFEVDAGVPVHRFEVWERIRAGVRLDSEREEPAPPVGDC